MAEIEHFVDPLNKAHPKFNNIKDIKVPLLTAKAQETDRVVLRDITIDEAVKNGIVNNETLGYFVARSFQFLMLCGIPAQYIRFRQHMKDEMAHYASDCWDAEVECSYGWIEIAGHADRSCFDLTQHAKATGIDLTASRPLKEPKKVVIK